nr:immunoglobulin light chain junction region [Macaca mulatta]MOV94983.1 immunoglobulin light chain junction region [Macaca mulatta]MOV98952.1 immunoglobulin light chain junction region [Macaca mulatta]MOV99183.1 immunoglobulin light chain junction region [Macaca mulatta]MOV99240.1 immunoglobulin light chain junction region [Macaca mulatta]
DYYCYSGNEKNGLF